MMDRELQKTCVHHPNRWDCADALIGYWDKSNTYGLIIHDGGSSMSVISFCPWCGKDLRLGEVMLASKKDLRAALNVIVWMTARLPDSAKTGDDWRDVDKTVKDLFRKL